ncbi:hypothetical protein AAY473_037204 [Plecturocebus cupreus]
MASSVVISISSRGDLETLPQQALAAPASSIKSSTSSDGNLETLAQEALQCNCVVAAYIGNKDLETLNLEALQHDLMASSFTPSTNRSTVAQAPTRPPGITVASSSIEISITSVGDLETLAQQALQCTCVVAAYIRNKDLETLILQALQHDLMASSFTQRSTTQSTLAQQSSQEATVLQARQPETVLARATSRWGCRKAAGRCISVLMRGPNKPSSITGCPPPS